MDHYFNRKIEIWRKLSIWRYTVTLSVLSSTEEVERNKYTVRRRHLTFSKQYFVGAFAFRSGNGNTPTKSVFCGFSLPCLGVRSFIAYGISRLMRCTNRKDDTETKVFFFFFFFFLTSLGEESAWPSGLGHWRCNPEVPGSSPPSCH